MSEREPTRKEIIAALERVLWGGCTQADLDLMDAVKEGRIPIVRSDKTR